MDILEAEGLTPKRLSTTAMRISRARFALEELSDRVFEETSSIKTDRVEFNLGALMEEPEEIVLRVLLRGMKDVCSREGYGARMERVETLCSDLLVCFSSGEPFRKRTLGGVIFEYKHDRALLILSPEK